MATLYPFRALRPTPADAPRIAAVPYDVVSTDEARALAEGNPLSFLRVSRAEIELPAGHDPYADAVYERAAENFAALRRTARSSSRTSRACTSTACGWAATSQTGLAACFSLDEYDRDIIKKHERTRRDKEDDRTRHMLALGAQTGPVFLTYRANADVDRVAAARHGRRRRCSISRRPTACATRCGASAAPIATRLVAAFARIPALYIADGHHRAASAARARSEMRERGAGTSLGDGRCTTMLAVAFPHDQVQILPYNRTVKDLGGLSPVDFLEAVRERFEIGSRSGRRRRAAARSRCTSRAPGTRCARASAPIDRTRSARSTSACCRSGCWRRC